MCVIANSPPPEAPSKLPATPDRYCDFAMLQASPVHSPPKPPPALLLGEVSKTSPVHTTLSPTSPAEARPAAAVRSPSHLRRHHHPLLRRPGWKRLRRDTQTRTAMPFPPRSRPRSCSGTSKMLARCGTRCPGRRTSPCLTASTARELRTPARIVAGDCRLDQRQTSRGAARSSRGDRRLHQPPVRCILRDLVAGPSPY